MSVKKVTKKTLSIICKLKFTIEALSTEEKLNKLQNKTLKITGVDYWVLIPWQISLPIAGYSHRCCRVHFVLGWGSTSAPEYMRPAFIAGVGSVPLKELIRIIYFFQYFGVDMQAHLGIWSIYLALLQVHLVTHVHLQDLNKGFFSISAGKWNQTVLLGKMI